MRIILVSIARNIIMLVDEPKTMEPNLKYFDTLCTVITIIDVMFDKMLPCRKTISYGCIN